MLTKYFLKADWQEDWSEVTERQFITAERAAGFRPKGGGDGLATGGFSGSGVRGRIEMVSEKLRSFLADHPCLPMSEEQVRMALGSSLKEDGAGTRA